MEKRFADLFFHGSFIGAENFDGTLKDGDFVRKEGISTGTFGLGDAFIQTE